jgi:hypothetical protein
MKTSTIAANHADAEGDEMQKPIERTRPMHTRNFSEAEIRAIVRKVFDDPESIASRRAFVRSMSMRPRKGTRCKGL